MAKFGSTIQGLLKEVERQTEVRKDYLAETNGLVMRPIISVVPAGETPKRDVEIAMTGNGVIRANNLAHRQIGEHIGVPAKYYDRMRQEAPELLSQNVNHWFQAQNSKRLVRCLDGGMRAFLSNGYRALENFDLIEAAVPTLIEQKMEIISCELTETRLYIKAVDMRCVRKIEGRRVIDGRMVDYDSVSPVCTISNSEVGMGALSIETGMFTHACKNMALFREKTLRKYHVGARHELTAGVQELLSSRTRALTDAAVWSQVKDVVSAAFDPARFEASLKPVEAMQADKIVGDPVKAVETAAKRFGFGEGERAMILRNLIDGANMTRYGLFNAVTRTAEDLADYDRATDFERTGGDIIELGRSEWRQIAEAA